MSDKKIEWGRIVKENLLNNVSIPRESDGVELNVVNMQVDTNLDNPVIMAEDKIEAYINKSIVGSHKQIVGDISVANGVAEKTIIDTYNGGGDITVKGENGDVTYNKGVAKTGDVIYFVSDGTGTYRPEEALVVSDGTLIKFTEANADNNRFTTIEALDVVQNGRLDVIEGDKDKYLKLDGSTPMDNGYGAKTDFEVVVKKDLDSGLTSLGVPAIEKRLETVEKNPAATYKSAVRKYEKDIDGILSPDELTKTFDLSTIVADDGKPFDFSADARIRIYWEEDIDDNGDGTKDRTITDDTDLIPGEPEKEVYSGIVDDGAGKVVAQYSVRATLSGAGLVTFIRTSKDDSGLWNTFKLIRVSEDVLANAVGFATKADLDAKQDKADNSLQTSTKSVVGAINEIKGLTDQDRTLLSRIGSIKVSDGNDLSTTDVTNTLVLQSDLSGIGIVDLTSKTTVGELYTAIKDADKLYAITPDSANPMAAPYPSVYGYDPNTGSIYGLATVDNKLGFHTLALVAGSTDPIVPTLGIDAATVKVVDDALSQTMEVTFDDSSVANYKVGK